MNFVFIGIVAAAAVGMGAVIMREQRVASPTPIRIRDIRRVFERLVATRADGAFAVFLFTAKGLSNPKSGGLSVQFSIENGRPGLDWVLEDSNNIAAKERVMAFFAERGSPLTSTTMNDVEYLRTEHGDLAALCRELLTKVFGVTDQQRMELITEGFEWGASTA